MTKFLKDVNAKALTALAVGTCGVTAFADGESSSSTIDLTPATTALSNMSTAVQTWIGTATPYLVGILGAALAVTLVWVAWKFIKKGTSKA